MEDSERKKIRIYNTAMLLLAGVSIVALNWYIYDNSAAGLGTLLGGFIGYLFVGGLGVWAFTRKKEIIKFLWPITLSLALAALLGFNAKQVYLIYDVKAAKKVLADVTGPTDFKRKLREGSDNRILTAMKFANEAAEDSVKEIGALVNRINPPELDVPMVYEKASLSDLQSYRMALKAAEGNATMAEAQIDFIFAREKARVEEYLKNNRFDHDFQRGFFRAIEPRHKDYGSFFKRFLQLKAEELNLSYSLLSVLIKEHGRYEQNISGSFIFANESAVTGFNELVNKLKSNQEQFQNITAEGEVLDQRYQKKLLKLLANPN